MNRQLMAALACIALTTACSSGSSSSTSPSAGGPQNRAFSGSEGTATGTAVTTNRVRLRRAGGDDIQTTLADGQVVVVPPNVKLDVWAEIARLEADRARLIVDWGNGNVDHIGCGACRLENTYTKTGRYTMKVSIVDLNAAAGAPPVTAMTVTIDVLDSTALSCAPSVIDFEGYGFSALPPFAAPGVSVSMSIGSMYSAAPHVDFSPELVSKVLAPGSDVTVTFDGDKNAFSMGIATDIPPSPVSYTAFDSGGTPVASGSATVSQTVTCCTGVKGSLSFVTATPFRRVVLSSGFSYGNIIMDNVRGTCR